MSKPDFVKDLANALKERNNPTDLKSCLIGTVKQIEPILIVSCEDGNYLLTENDELYISEWFRFRCNIDKTTALSASVPENLESAKGVEETHSQSGSPCSMPDAIAYLAEAINSINSELLALKCNLAIDDYVLIASLEQENKYILIDKVL